jgi:6-pyruvoyltetrahydropterin/6-carboxytetrahydropterin synthase
MSRASLTHIAGARFEGARRLRTAPPHHRLGRWHGHSFAVTLEAQADDEGGHSPIEDLLSGAVAPLDYADLGVLMDEPTDRTLADWIARRAGVPGWSSVKLHSAPGHAVTLAAGGVSRLSRRYRFEAAHRLPNVPPGHQCGRMHGHGFEVELSATLADTPEWELAHRLDLAWSAVHSLLHYRCLNEIEGLDNPTSEMIAGWIWQRMNSQEIPLAGVCVFETVTAGSRYDGQRYTIWKEKRFDAALQVAGAPAGDPRTRLHGHGYQVRLYLCAPPDETLGWVMDFGDVKRLFSPLFHQLDHQRIDQIEGLARADAAGLLEWMRERAAPVLPALSAIELFEQPGCGARLEWP